MANEEATVPLGAIAIIGSTFQLLFRRFLLFLGIAFVPMLFMSVLQLTAFADILQPGFAPDSALDVFGPGYFVFLALSMIVGLLTIGAETLAAYDASLGRPIRIGAYISRTLAAAPAIVVLGLLLYLIVVVGFMLLIIPGLYLLARYWVMTPAILVEGAGYRGLSRAAELSRGYRWQILGSAIVLFILLFLITTGLSALVYLAVGADPFSFTNSPGPFVVVLASVIPGTLQYAILSVYTALLYARLRELKEGLGMEDLASVFA